MDKKLGQQPAFATSAFGDGEGVYDPGMSTRLYIATMAMKGILSGELMNLRSDTTGDTAYPLNTRRTFNKTKLVKNAYDIADELLNLENE